MQRKLQLAIFALTAVAVAQQSEAPIKVTTRLIETNVVVRDSHGPVGDLKESDFRLFDSGKEQKIAIFRISTSEPQRVEEAPPPLPPGVFSNRYAKVSVRPARRILLLIDTLNTEKADQVFVQKQVLLMLKSTEISDPTGLYVLGQKSRLLQDFTMDKNLLTRAMEAFQPEESRELFMSHTPTPAMVGGPTDKMVAQSFEGIRAFGNRDRALATLDAFEQLGKYLMRVPGRKSVVWISNAFPARSLDDRLDRMQLLNRADVAIYPVHARGLVDSKYIANPRAGAVDLGRVGCDRLPGGSSLPQEEDTMNWIAEETGGRAFYDRSDVDAAIREAIQDGEVTYTLGFYSQYDKPDGNFHALKVKVGRPGVDVRHRAGYFDVDKKMDKKTDAKPDAHAAAVPEDASDIGLIVAIARKGASFQVAVQIDFKDLRLESADGKWKGSAELAFASQSADGRTLDLASKKLSFDMTNEAYQARQREGFAIEQMIPVRDGTAKIRVVIVDRSGAAGSVSITPPK